MSSLSQGVLGFISGFAGGKAEEADLLAGEERAEALRLRKEESALLKERRLLKIRSDFASKENVRQLQEEGFLDPQGSVITEGLEPEFAQSATIGTIRKLRERQSLVDKERISRSEKPFTAQPGATITTQEEALRLAQKPGGHTFPVAEKTPAQIESDVRRSISDARKQLTVNFPGSDSSADLDTLRRLSADDLSNPNRPNGRIFRAYLRNRIMNNAFSEIGDAARARDERVASMTSQQMIDAISQKVNDAEADVVAAGEALVPAFDKAMQNAVDIMGDQALPKNHAQTIAKRLIEIPREWTLPNSEPATFSWKEQFAIENLDTPEIMKILMNSMTKSRSVIQ